MTDSTDAELDVEARLFGRYLVGEPPAPDVVARYRDAVRALWPDAATDADRSVLDFVRRHPWSVGPLDAAAALLDRGGVLRGRVLVAAALLEATPAYADRFLPRAVSAAALLGRLAIAGAASAALAIVGVALWPVARRAAR